MGCFLPALILSKRSRTLVYVDSNRSTESLLGQSFSFSRRPEDPEPGPRYVKVIAFRNATPSSFSIDRSFSASPSPLVWSSGPTDHTGYDWQLWWDELPTDLGREEKQNNPWQSNIMVDPESREQEFMRRSYSRKERHLICSGSCMGVMFCPFLLEVRSYHHCRSLVACVTNPALWDIDLFPLYPLLLNSQSLRHEEARITLPESHSGCFAAASTYSPVGPFRSVGTIAGVYQNVLGARNYYTGLYFKYFFWWDFAPLVSRSYCLFQLLLVLHLIGQPAQPMSIMFHAPPKQPAIVNHCHLGDSPTNQATKNSTRSPKGHGITSLGPRDFSSAP